MQRVIIALAAEVVPTVPSSAAKDVAGVIPRTAIKATIEASLITFVIDFLEVRIKMGPPMDKNETIVTRGDRLSDH